MLRRELRIERPGCSTSAVDLRIICTNECRLLMSSSSVAGGDTAAWAWDGARSTRVSPTVSPSLLTMLNVLTMLTNADHLTTSCLGCGRKRLGVERLPYQRVEGREGREAHLL